MFRLTLLLHAIVSTVLMGTGITAALVLGYVSGIAIGAAILGGLVFGWPIARLIAKELYEE
ncbi:CTP synthetase [Tropicimonas sp. IMCC6043]|uniref:CTP synthetase n=1 Tax=Tropicimonas sp. IMCC6043 TaxID=2510645 RepID=UPI00101B6DB3|nr:CTP synthetase [Tropicimonas sp. IMCC6043]RYH10555.1 CTP synthetase [Tropicimonas sp. IMCC6043]